ncbi:hypothetical protein BFW38_00910 [Terasakiispira papahanaumokuakeensis]|uniref:Uncharacterized protein n=1 Tax=Terasakiispira papahanaumokuakeensis TaxID=197479 RepID=A0A1E2V5Q0_9GAMM|nr:hypothetical protein BFW38_00910 [Terasakiispira papahanaumokuakeensis]
MSRWSGRRALLRQERRRAKEYVAALDDLETQGFEGLGRILRIDSDDLREELLGYIGSNFRLFQGTVSILVDRIHNAIRALSSRIPLARL